MSNVVERTETQQLLVHLSPVIEMNDAQFFEFCQLNRDLRIERTADGDLLIMPPVGGRTGRRNNKLAKFFLDWEEHDPTGISFDSSTGFTLPNGAKRSPDASWVKRSRLADLTEDQKDKYLPLCPDVVVELRSPSDSLVKLQEKMQEYTDNGAQLGWLVDAAAERVYVYRRNKAVERLDAPETLSGEDVMPGFVLELNRIWNADF